MKQHHAVFFARARAWGLTARRRERKSISRSTTRSQVADRASSRALNINECRLRPCGPLPSTSAESGPTESTRDSAAGKGRY